MEHAEHVDALSREFDRRLDPDVPGVALSGRSELVAHRIDHSALG